MTLGHVMCLLGLFAAKCTTTLYVLIPIFVLQHHILLIQRNGSVR